MAQIYYMQKSERCDDFSKILFACEKLGIPFNCRAGLCCRCRIKIVSGMENLEPMSRQEEFAGIKPPYRLACQCVVRQGQVRIELP